MKTIGLDIGTTTICAAVLQSETGEQLDRITVESGAALSSDTPWERLQSPEKIEATCVELLGVLRKRHPDAGRLGITGQMHGLLYLDGTGCPLSPLYTWEDGRGNQLCGDGRTCARLLSDLTGWPMATGYGLTTLFYNRAHGLAPEGASFCCTVMDYIAMAILITLALTPLTFSFLKRLSTGE